MAEFVDADAPLVLVYEGGRWCEGPVWDTRTETLIFSDVRRNRILRLDADGRASVLRDPSANANGNAIDAQGRLVTCEHRNSRVVRQEADGSLTVLADRHEGRRLNSPNDLAIAHDGAIWFTDPTYGIDNPEEGNPRPSEQRGRFVFRLDADGTLDVVADGFEQPNGIVFSPDGGVLYVSDTGGGTDPEGPREIRAFDVVDERRLTGERLFARLDSGVPDGLDVDVEGRVYAAAGDGVRIWAADSTYLGRIATSGACGNLAFGGSDGRRLYICNGTRIYAVGLKVWGAHRT